MANDRVESEFWAGNLKREPPTPEIRALGAALALASEGRFAELTALYRAARDLGIASTALVEGALSAHLFAGFPRAIEAFAVLFSVFPPAPAGIDRRTAGEVRDAGSALFSAIYGKNAGAVRDQLERFAPDFARAVLEDAYGRVLSRPVLDGKTRELAAVCALASSGLDRQLFSHLRGAVAFGASRREAAAMVELATVISPATAANALVVLERALPVP